MTMENTMAYDEALGARIRPLLVERDDVREQKMFGGLAFMVGDRSGSSVRYDSDSAGSQQATPAAPARPHRGYPAAAAGPGPGQPREAHDRG
jgi:hypothetical protein